MDTEKVLIYNGKVEYRIELLKQYLADNDIPSFSINKMDSFYPFGEIELYVYRNDAIKAKMLINKFEN